MLNVIKAIDWLLLKIQEYAIMICVLAMVLFIVWQVIARYILYLPTPYAEEFARLAIVWCVFIGATVAVRYEEHMRVDVLFNRLPRPVRLFVQCAIYVMMMIFSVVMIRYGIDHVRSTANDFATALGYSRNVFYMPAPVCGVLIFLYSLGNMIKYLIFCCAKPGQPLSRKQAEA